MSTRLLQIGPTEMFGEEAILTALSGREEISRPFEFFLTIASPKAALKPSQVVGRVLAVRIDRGAKEPRYIHGYSPSRIACKAWEVGVVAGPIKKRFQVTSPREWTRRLGGFRLSEIEPVMSVDIRYESAFGGKDSTGQSHLHNPVGIGSLSANGTPEIRCPQLLPVGVEEPVFGRPLQVLGLGPLAPSWSPRLQCAGTVDDNWRMTRFPYLPLDFDFLFYNAAPADQIFPGFAQGDEIIRLYNLSPNHELSFGLPGIDMIHVIQFEDGRLIPAPIKLDTIQIDVNRMKVFLEWRGIYPLHVPIKLIEVRLSAPNYLRET